MSETNDSKNKSVLTQERVVQFLENQNQFLDADDTSLSESANRRAQLTSKFQKLKYFLALRAIDKEFGFGMDLSNTYGFFGFIVAVNKSQMRQQDKDIIINNALCNTILYYENMKESDYKHLVPKELEETLRSMGITLENEHNKQMADIWQKRNQAKAEFNKRFCIS